MDPEPEEKFEFYGVDEDLYGVFTERFGRTLRAIGLVALGLSCNEQILPDNVESLTSPSEELLGVIVQIRDALLRVRPISMRLDIFDDVLGDLGNVREILFAAVGDSVLSPSAADEICHAIHADIFDRFLKANEKLIADEAKRISDEAAKAAAESSLREADAYQRGVTDGKNEALKKRRQRKK